MFFSPLYTEALKIIHIKSLALNKQIKRPKRLQLQIRCTERKTDVFPYWLGKFSTNLFSIWPFSKKSLIGIYGKSSILSDILTKLTISDNKAMCVFCQCSLCLVNHAHVTYGQYAVLSQRRGAFRTCNFSQAYENPQYFSDTWGFPFHNCLQLELLRWLQAVLLEETLNFTIKVFLGSKV